jgi:hypothetical protein
MTRSSTSSALKHLSRQRSAPRSMAELIAGINSDNDRATAVLWSTVLDDALHAAISGRMGHLTAADHELLFHDFGPLRSFGAKILVGHGMSVVGREEKADLETVREIADAFANPKVEVCFRTPEVATACGQLHATAHLRQAAGEPQDPKELFILTCVHLASAIDPSIGVGEGYPRREVNW